MSSKFSSSAKPSPLALPGRWVVGFAYAHSGEHERRYYCPRGGYATREEALAAVVSHDDRDSHKVFLVPPLETSGDHRVGPALLRGDVTQEDLVSFVEAFLNNREAQLEPLRARLAVATAGRAAPEPEPTYADRVHALLAAVRLEDVVADDAWTVDRDDEGEPYEYWYDDAESAALRRAAFALLDAGPPPVVGPATAAKLAAAERLVAALLPSGRREWADQSPYMNGPGNAVCRADFSSYDNEQDGEPVFDEDGEEKDSVYYSFHPDQSREIHAAVSDWFAASED